MVYYNGYEADLLYACFALTLCEGKPASPHLFLAFSFMVFTGTLSRVNNNNNNDDNTPRISRQCGRTHRVRVSSRLIYIFLRKGDKTPLPTHLQNATQTQPSRTRMEFCKEKIKQGCVQVFDFPDNGLSPQSHESFFENPLLDGH